MVMLDGATCELGRSDPATIQTVYYTGRIVARKSALHGTSDDPLLSLICWISRVCDLYGEIDKLDRKSGR